MARRTGRPKAGEGTLTRERILESALKLVDREGMEALSMRRLAAELGVDPMALYYHVPNKGALISGLVERVFSEMPPPISGEEDWRERIRHFAHAYRNLARGHPSLVRYLVSSSASAATLKAGEPLYAALEAGGFSARTVVLAADVVVDYVNGFALAEVSGPLGSPGDRKGLLDLLDEQSEENVPVMRRVFGALANEELSTNFEFGLQVILDGLQAYSGRAG